MTDPTPHDDTWIFSPEWDALHEMVISVGRSYIDADNGKIRVDEVDHKEQIVMDYVGSLLAARDAEIARLHARQITPEIVKHAGFVRHLINTPIPSNPKDNADIPQTYRRAYDLSVSAEALVKLIDAIVGDAE